ncbi:MAG: GNAT family N-acetyltransferase [Verrucomicrobiota bacterium]
MDSLPSVAFLPLVKPTEPLPLTVCIREFRIADFGGALAVWRMVDGVEVAEGDSEEEVTEYLLRNPGLSRVAERGNTIIGAALCGHDGRRGLIYHLAVAPEYQAKGIGQRLLQECVSGLRNAGLTRALILVSGENATGRSFWLRNSWEDIPGAILMGLDL